MNRLYQCLASIQHFLAFWTSSAPSNAGTIETCTACNGFACAAEKRWQHKLINPGVLVRKTEYHPQADVQIEEPPKSRHEQFVQRICGDCSDLQDGHGEG